MKPIAEEITELRDATVPELVARYRAVFGREPRVKHREWLWKRVAWKIQEQRLGGLSGVGLRKLESLMADIELPTGDDQRTVTGKLAQPRKPKEPAVGTAISRMWKGQEIRVHVRENGFEHDGVLYPSLSATARAITGSRWNGKLFFEITKRKHAP